MLYFCISVLCAVYMVSRARLRAGCIHHVVYLYLFVVCNVHGVKSPSSSRLYPPCCLSVSLCCVQCSWCREPVFEQAVSAMLYFCVSACIVCNVRAWCREPVFEQAVSTTLYLCISARVVCNVHVVDSIFSSILLIAHFMTLYVMFYH